MHKHQQVSVLDHKWASLHALPDRVRNPSLAMLMVVRLFLLLGLTATVLSIAFGRYWSQIAVSFLNHCGFLPLSLFARSLAYLETILVQFYIGITIARLMTLELEDRRRGRE
jgi:hypothetical protein